MPQSFVSIYAHIIFSTKDREPWLTADHLPEVLKYIGGIVRADRCVLLAAGGMPDHVHLLVSFGKQTDVADLVRLIKSNSSKWIHETIPPLGAFAWQAGYAAFSVSRSNLDAVKEYIRRQEEHHRKRTFQDEYRQFLIAHDIEFDERYVWD
jgi:REP element-mobilizing transposase RayT